jgi:hypothetical protein
MEKNNSNKWLSVSTSRNDGDMIETFVRGNSRYIDTFIILDDSTDHTREICKLLRLEGFDIRVIHKPGIVADQKTKTNWMFHKYADPRKFSALVPLDVDEVLIPTNSIQSIQDFKVSVETSLIDWVPFAPSSLDPFADSNPFLSGFRGTANTQGRIKKIILSSSDFSKNGEIAIGAHNYRSTNVESVTNIHSKLGLGHFPIRSANQLLSKLFTALSAVRLKVNKAKGESAHVVELLRLISALQFQPSFTDLQMFSAYYGCFSEINPDSHIIFSGTESLLPEIENRFTDLGNVNLNKNLFELVMELTDELVRFSGVKKSVDRKYRVA